MNSDDTSMDRHSALFTDLYQLTMCQAYWKRIMDEEAVFDLFIRRMRERNFFVVAGLEQALAFLESVSFSEQDIAYLRSLDLFEPDFLEHLRSFSFEGDVWAMPEGTIAFANEPLLQVEAPIAQAQLVETFLLNQITFQTGVASKAARVVLAAAGRPVADFGARRAHGTDAAIKAARAAYIAGAASTSNVLAGQQFGIPVTGTMAHSYVEAHDAEMEAFRAFTEQYPETILLVDTYDTIAGVRKVVELADEMGDAFQVRGIRLDSGDLGELARQARALLDKAGLEEVQIVASSSLDEHRIKELLAEEARIDLFGVGTRMVTMQDYPALDSAYKLSFYAGEGRMKLSTGKSNLPGRKQVVRQWEGESAVKDRIARRGESIEGRPLLRCVMRDGERTDAGRSTIEAARERAAAGINALPEPLRSLSAPDSPYPVELTAELDQETEAVRERLERRMLETPSAS